MIFRIIAGLIAVITAAGGYLSFKYSTTSTCMAAEAAVVQEMPRVLQDLRDNDRRAYIAELVLGPSRFRTEAQVVAIEGVQDRSAFECIQMVVEREVSPSSFREGVVADLETYIDNLI